MRSAAICFIRSLGTPAVGPPRPRLPGEASCGVARTAYGPRALFIALLALSTVADAQHLLLPMDDAQANHLKAYGVTFNALTEGVRAEWFINYRGGAFLLPDVPFVRRRASLDGVTFEAVGDAALDDMRREIANSNADAVPLEKAPKIAVYSPPNSPPWDDAVTLALRYAGIPYTRIWDDEALVEDLGRYDWIHLFHEDFTGQLNKLHLSYRDAPWFVDQRERDLSTARRHGYPSIPALKKVVAARLRAFLDRGGFLFAMCGATETLELALASQGVDIAGPYSDGSPMDPDADNKMDWGNALAVSKARLEMSTGVNAMSDIDGHQVNVPARRQPLGSFQLFAFSAKLDPVATMLVQNHRGVIPDFYGVTTSFMRAALRPAVTVLAYEDGAPWVKYVHGDLGKGAWTYLGGHDPEDPQHNIGAPPTDLALHPNSPGYRLILNNVLFPAARKKPHKT